MSDIMHGVSFSFQLQPGMPGRTMHMVWRNLRPCWQVRAAQWLNTMSGTQQAQCRHGSTATASELAPRLESHVCRFKHGGRGWQKQGAESSGGELRKGDQVSLDPGDLWSVWGLLWACRLNGSLAL